MSIDRVLFPGGIQATVLGILLLLLGSTTAAQTTGTIYGQISDPTGAALPKADVRAENVGTGLIRKAISNDLGAYQVPSLPSGPYRLTVEHPGFKTFSQTGITVVVGENARVDAALQVGLMNQTVDVSGRALDVDTQSSTVGATVDSRRIADMPLNGRNVLGLTQLLPGVGKATLPPVVLNARVGPTMIVDGSRSNQNNVQLDGTFMFESISNLATNLPSPDSIQEFRALTSTYDAQYGRASGAVLLAVTKSGTKQFHGSLFEYFRNDVLNARNYFAPGEKPVLRQNQFGGTIGGPVFFPGYNKGRDRTFFFFGYQGTRIVQQFLVTNFPPNQQERQGDFSASAQPVMDPTTGLPFQGNQIPSTRFDPMAVNILSTFIPLPNQPDGRSVLLNKNPTSGNQYTLTADHQLTSSDHLKFRWFHEVTGVKNAGAGLGAGDILNVGSNSGNRVDSENLAYTRIFSPRLLNQLTVSRLYVEPTMDQVSKVGPKDLGGNYNFDGPVPYTPASLVIGRFFMFPLFTFFEPDTNWLIKENLTWVRGRHSLKVGADIGILHHHTEANIFAGGFSIFVPAFTGNSFADFLIGRPVAFSADSFQKDDSRSRNYHFYAQDDFKVNSRFTLNLGLRYELNPPWWQEDGRGNEVLRGRQSTLFPTSPPGLVYPGDPGIPRGLVATDKNDFAPRIGFAWDPTGGGRTAIRAAYGIFYEFEGAGFSSNSVNKPPFTLAVSRFPTSFSDPYDVANGGIDPFPYTFDPANPTFPSGTYDATSINPNLRNGYMQNFNFNIQQQFTDTLVLEVGYVGKLGRKIAGYHDMNQAVFGPGATPGNVQERRPYENTHYAAINEETSDRNSSYHALQVNLQKRFSRGYTFQVAYTLSKSIDQLTGQYLDSTETTQDNNNYLQDMRGLSSWDQRHIVAVNYIWEVPWLKNSVVLGGWQFAGITRYSGGSPFSISCGCQTALVGTTQRADIIGDFHLDPSRSHPDLINMYFNTAAFAQPATGTFGNSGRNIVTGPGFFTTDLSLQKNFRLPGEMGKFQFRADGFNIFNNVNFDNPGATLGSPGFGQIVSSRDARIVQLALRYDF